MPYIPEPNNKMRREHDSTIDKIVGFTITAPNSHRTIPLDTDRIIDIPKPYLRHDIKQGKTYMIGKKDTQILELSDALKNERFNNSIYIEFYCEDATDSSSKTRAEEFHTNASKALHNAYILRSNEYLGIKISVMNNPISNISRCDKHPYGQFLTFSTVGESEYCVTPDVQK